MKNLLGGQVANVFLNSIKYTTCGRQNLGKKQYIEPSVLYFSSCRCERLLTCKWPFGCSCVSNREQCYEITQYQK